MGLDWTGLEEYDEKAGLDVDMYEGLDSNAGLANTPYLAKGLIITLLT